MSPLFRIDYPDEAAARATVARLSMPPSADTISVRRDGASVEFALANPAANELAKLPWVIGDAFRSLTGKLAELCQRPATSE